MSNATATQHVLQQFADGRGIDLEQYEALEWQLYDTQKYLAAGQTQLSFFTEGRNTGTSIYDASQKKTYEDTNMPQGGVLPRGQAMLVRDIALRIKPGVAAVQETIAAAAPASSNPAANDERTFWDQGWVDFRLANKPEVLLGPLANFPPPQAHELHFGAAAAFAQATAADESVYIEGSSLTPRGRMFSLFDPGLTLEFGVDFTFSLNWTTLVPMPSNTDAVIKAAFMGWLLRAKQ